MQYATKILPIRKKGNLLLCTLLVGNVAVNAGISIMLADITSGFLGFALSTIFIVIFGEIMPQAICSRYGLYLGSKVVWLMWMLIVLLFVFTYPIAKILDCILGQELGTILTKQQI